MRIKRMAAIAAVAALALGVAACGDDDGGGTGGSGGSAATGIVDKAQTDKKLVIGVKADQPGLGLADRQRRTRASTSRSAKIIAKELGVEESGIEWKDDRVGQPRAVHPAGPGRHRRRDLHDQRRAQAEGQLRRPVLRRRPGPAGRPTTLDHHRPGVAGTARRSARSPAPPRPSGSRTSTRRTRSSQEFDAYSKCVDGAGRRPGRRGHHRRHHPGRATPRRPVRRQVQGGRQAVQRRSRTASA